MGRRHADLANHLWAENLQEVQDALGQCFGVPLLFVDPSGRPLAVCEDLTEFCRWLTRAIPLSRPCLGCDRGERLSQAGGFPGSLRSSCRVHTCPLGVADAVAPICSAGDIIAYLLTAQLRLTPEPDQDRLPAGARPTDADEHVALVSRLRHASRKDLERAAIGLGVIASVTGSLAASRRRNLRLAERIREQTRWIQANERTDAVTGLANRRHFCAVLELELARARRYQRSLSLAVLDVHGFRQINDEFGHEVGDAVLRSIAHTVASAIRQTDVVGRVGADELAIIFTETGREGAMIALGRVLAQIEDVNASGELPVEIRLAAGVCEHSSGTEDLLAEALLEVRQAKQAQGLPADSLAPGQDA